MFKKLFIFLGLICGLSNITFAADENFVADDVSSVDSDSYLPREWNDNIGGSLASMASGNTYFIKDDDDNYRFFIRDIDNRSNIEVYHISNPSRCIIKRPNADESVHFAWNQIAEDYLLESDGLRKLFLYRIIYNEDGSINDIYAIKGDDKFDKSYFDLNESETVSLFVEDANINSNFENKLVSSGNIDSYIESQDIFTAIDDADGLIFCKDVFLLIHRDLNSNKCIYIQIFDYNGSFLKEYNFLKRKYYAPGSEDRYVEPEFEISGIKGFENCFIMDLDESFIVVYHDSSELYEYRISKDSLRENVDFKLICDVEATNDCIVLKHKVSAESDEIETKYFSHFLSNKKEEKDVLVTYLVWDFHPRRPGCSLSGILKGKKTRNVVGIIAGNEYGMLRSRRVRRGRTSRGISNFARVRAGEPSGSGSGSGEEPSYMSGAGGPGAGGSLSNHDDDNDRRGVTRDPRPRKKSRHSE